MIKELFHFTGDALTRTLGGDLVANTEEKVLNGFCKEVGDLLSGHEDHMKLENGLAGQPRSILLQQNGETMKKDIVSVCQSDVSCWDDAGVMRSLLQKSAEGLLPEDKDKMRKYCDRYHHPSLKNRTTCESKSGVYNTGRMGGEEKWRCTWAQDAGDGRCATRWDHYGHAQSSFSMCMTSLVVCLWLSLRHFCQ